MKKLLTLLLMVWSVLTLSAQSLVVKVTLTDGTVKEFPVSMIQSIAFDEEPYVDLGLESGVKWATMNVGATNMTEAGTPYKWDEAADVIKNQWTNLYPNQEWRMPTKEEFQELIDACDWSEIKDETDKVIGYKVAKKGNENLFIVFPFADHWSASAYDSEMAWYLRPAYQEMKRTEKVEQLLIRPVWGKPIVTATIETGTPEVEFTTAAIPVKVVTDGDIVVGTYGIRYSTNADMAAAKQEDGIGKLEANTDAFVSLKDLRPNTTYYYQAYANLETPATNLESEIASFTTRSKELSVEVTLTNKTTTTASLDLAFKGNFVDDVYYTVLYGQDPNLIENTVGTFKIEGGFKITKTDTEQIESIDLVDLEPGKKYYYLVKAQYSDFEATPAKGNFTTSSQTLSVTATASNVGFNSADITIEVTSNLQSEVAYDIEYGFDQALTNPMKKSGKIQLTSTEGQKETVELGGLEEGKKYYYRVVARIGEVTETSGVGSFETTARSLRVVATVSPLSATTARATLTFVGNVTGAISYELYYGEDQVMDQSVTGNFTMTQTAYATSEDKVLTNLKANQSYSFKLVARYAGGDDVSTTGTFNTPAKELKIEGVGATNITAKSASIQMSLVGNALEPVLYEITYSKNQDMSGALKVEGNVQLSYTSSQTFSVGIDQLEEETTYYFTVSVKYVDTEAISMSGTFKTPEKVVFVVPDKVDLGCSVLWGTFNLGAKDVTGRGGFFGWGDPTGEKISQAETYGNAGLTPPVDLTKVHQELDIVHVTLEDKWHTPTSAQMLELLNKCTWTHKTNYMGVYGLDGYEVRGKGAYSSNYIFIPHNGCRAGVDAQGNPAYSSNTNESYYWSSELTDNPWGYGVYVKLQTGTSKAEKEMTFYGMYIRPVYDGSGDTPEPPVSEDHSLEIAKTTDDGQIVPAEGVDLGLSVTWASWNLGATETTTQSGVTIGQVGQLGGYYSWGETSTKSRYRLADYLYGDSPLPETTLTAEHDAAVQNWGDGWRMPTEDEWDELVINCTVKWESVNGLQGYRYTSKKNGRSIFIPAGGVNNGSLLFSDYGYYWSSTKHPTDKQRATCMLFNNGQFNDPSTPYERFCGMPIRPVKKK